ncbi:MULTISPECIES: pitrilysin family protein [unclassified Imperialibacter]|uniref:M16 family metallopeptidase n=1 Tax=unclassified Imperialibacter TaxID=2629706 RepID=UPI001258568A|nr:MULTISPECIES: pitrilysin family protein [unclassified Imperialibacter]CAD5290925.1 Predicted Zn-dependent peptidase [Imperialibacter sp. 89]CAD5291171.1 Predicted Zn-dependent peptidase [Imperialibacter sp. 75]VVT34413.1 Predicted Zn-dependent peptidase [Imperialibacter sp. EC-SDR9]
MIQFESFKLANGLEVHVIPDPSTELAVVNILYKVGSRDEEEHKTGFAHLFEHLMFGGSKHIPSYDEPLQLVGGENNAFTSPDITNYYITLPAANIETAFWLESDRMLSLSFDPRVLEVQQKVVIEEFKQRYLNQPYGDIWLKLRPLAYKEHSYKWATIGKEISHIENATMSDVQDFFFKYYRPNNAILVVAGKVTTEQVRKLAEKWFGPIPAGDVPARHLRAEPTQNEARILNVQSKVPLSALYKTFHMSGRAAGNYQTIDFLGDILGRGKSSRLYNVLVKEKKIFNSIQSYVLGSIDPGLLMIDGKLNEGHTFDEAEKAIDEVLSEIKSKKINDDELVKVKNKALSSLVFSEVELLNQAMNVAFMSFLGDPNWVNKETDKIDSVTTDNILDEANNILTKANSSTLYYEAIK